ncbi:hypothetical protein HMPREF1531_01827 [Propionibacterium sp. oral taxon 192 str. F0372]|uniref:ABC transporter ATP-binding protein n=1 Tax=Propionibacterium sp. oral taxon 192 TaxID=671222 RepID=UPI000352936A|nr:ABC transporter ATP-binding protein [Propionibacterium sp. oral taxon 192]EPH02519.1 hypothetical protein HMPREF1531_01827 [Propionibacterium sp. oral taxon 192 str. F0372]
MPAPDKSPQGVGPRRVDPADRAQLAESPVPMYRVAELMNGQYLRLLVLLAVITATALIGVANPFLLKAVIDDALPHDNDRLLVGAVVGMIGLAVIGAVAGVWQTWLANLIGQAVMHDLRVKVFANVQRQSMNFFKHTKTGEIQSRLVNDIAGLQTVFTSTATSIATNFTTAVAKAVAMVALDWRLSVVSMIILPPAFWVTRKVALLRRDITAERQRLLAQMNTEVVESMGVNGALLTKTLGIAEERAERFSRASQDLVGLDLRTQLAGRWRMGVMSVLFAAMPAIIYLAAGLGPSGMTLGTVVAFTTLQTQIFRPVMGLLNIGVDWVASLALMSRVFGYLDLVPEVAEPSEPIYLDPKQARGEVRFTKVGYRYPDAETNVLTDINLVVSPGRSLGIVGATGSGKSTLASMISRLCDPITGEITIDGIDLRRIASTNLAELVGVVSQETWLGHDTLRNNLLMAKPDASDEELWRVLRVARMDQVVTELPEGLDTMVGARGHRFSGGERQRVAVARTLLRNPRILVLDEATSALDSGTERDVQAALDELVTGRTTITIAHRLSAIRHADEIIVMVHGRIVERGDHQQLMAVGGIYRELVDAGSRDVVRRQSHQ